MFYGLTQAGRAVCAGGVPSGAWEGIGQHGLRFGFTQPATSSPLRLDAVTVAPSGRGLIHQVAEVLGSPVLAGPATLGELICSLDSEVQFEGSNLRHPRPLEVSEHREIGIAWESLADPGLLLMPVPEFWTERVTHVPAGPSNLAYTQIPEPSVEEFQSWVAPYPSLARLGSPSAFDPVQPSFADLVNLRYLIRAHWAEPQLDGAGQRAWTLEHMDVVYEAHPDPKGVALPAVGGNTEAQHLLITWWLVLYCLSMLARYHPTSWTEMLDVDSSPLAVPMDHLINAGRARVPDLLSEVLHTL